MLDLTKRQTQIAELIIKGLENKEIAYELKITESCIKSHVLHMFRRTNTKNRVQLAMAYLRGKGALG